MMQCYLTDTGRHCGLQSVVHQCQELIVLSIFAAYVGAVA